SAQIREILISESAWEEMTCLFAPSLVHLSSGPVKEEWKIEHQVEKTKSGKNFIQTRMIRPDGNFVVPASSERGIFSGKHYSQAS
ncbi:hypothetical protein M8B93_24305, partial [Enterobacter hormaechei subsp. xiangfangensis]|nr:hypothetical protein [Enterobacter hormaechei subsp. xiangfangensis]